MAHPESSPATPARLPVRLSVQCLSAPLGWEHHKARNHWAFFYFIPNALCMIWPLVVLSEWGRKEGRKERMGGEGGAKTRLAVPGPSLSGMCPFTAPPPPTHCSPSRLALQGQPSVPLLSHLCSLLQGALQGWPCQALCLGAVRMNASEEGAVAPFTVKEAEVRAQRSLSKARGLAGGAGLTPGLSTPNC